MVDTGSVPLDLFDALKKLLRNNNTLFRDFGFHVHRLLRAKFAVCILHGTKRKA